MRVAFHKSRDRSDRTVAVVPPRGAAGVRALAFAAVTAGLVTAGQARAAAPGAGPTEDGSVCEVLPTADGFAALRAGPAVSAKLIARMKTEANVVVQERPKHHVVRQGGWIQVRYWPDGELPGRGEPGYDKAVTGWVAQRLIGECG